MRDTPTRMLVASVLLLSVSAFEAPRPARGEEETPGRELEQAAEHVLAGRLPEARRLVDAFPAERRKAPAGAKPWSDEAEAATRIDLRWRLLDALLGPSEEDPFELVAAIVLASNGWDETDAVDGMPWFELFTRYAVRERYPIAARTLLQRGLDREGGDDEDDLARLLASLPASRSAAAGEAPDAVTRALLRRLEAPRWQPYGVGPLAPAFEPLALGAEEERERAQASLERFAFPETFTAVRAEIQEQEAVAIGTSQDYDPVGEISAGAYWVIRSHDGGRTWGRALYTGLRVHAPYVVRQVSNAPLFDGDRLQVEVRLAEIDPESITFPPIGMHLKREQGDLLLHIAFADLERDADGDGLTDLAEERLLTDPLVPDTDGDGLADGRDAVPLVPLAPGSDEAARALGPCSVS